MNKIFNRYIGLINDTTTEMNEEVINCLNKLVYIYTLNGNHIDVDDTKFYVSNLIEHLLKHPIYNNYIENFLNEYELYSKKVENEVEEITEYAKNKMPNFDRDASYPRYILKRENGHEYIHENNERNNPLIERFKKSYVNTTFNHAIIANISNIYLDDLTAKMNYLKFQILKIELTIKFSVKSYTTDLLEIVNQNYLVNYISIQEEFKKYLKKHSLLVFDSAIDYVSKSPSKHYYDIYNSKNNLQIELNSNVKCNDFYSLRTEYPNIGNVHHLMYIYYRQLIPHYEYDLPRSVIVECIENQDEKLWNILCTKKNISRQTLKIPKEISHYI